MDYKTRENSLWELKLVFHTWWRDNLTPSPYPTHFGARATKFFIENCIHVQNLNIIIKWLDSEREGREFVCEKEWEREREREREREKEEREIERGKMVRSVLNTLKRRTYEVDF